MSNNNKYLVIDIGTGNVRVAVTDTSGKILKLATDDVIYHIDEDYTHSIYFQPDQLWEQILKLTSEVIEPQYAKDIVAITSSSQREGIVILDNQGKSLLGMPNIDHRGRDYEEIIEDKDRVYQLTGRYPTSLFSAFKWVGLTKKKTEVANQTATFLSISDWVLFQVGKVKVYEHSQASETLLYDVEQKKWSDELCKVFSISAAMLPPLVNAGTIVAQAENSFTSKFGLNPTVQVIVGGADTQLAVESILPAQDDIVLVSGTTTPVIKIVNEYITDTQQRTWTNSHTTPEYFILETNAGVTGLNYQRFKTIFYPNEDYAILEKEVFEIMNSAPECYAALGSLLCNEKTPLTKGGFIMNTPLSHTLVRGHFTFALLWDLACSIYENYMGLTEITPNKKDYVWACGGGMQSLALRQLLANLSGKEIRMRTNYRQATVTGCAFICNHALGINNTIETETISVFPDEKYPTTEWYLNWKKNRTALKSMQ